MTRYSHFGLVLAEHEDGISVTLATYSNVLCSIAAMKSHLVAYRQPLQGRWFASRTYQVYFMFVCTCYLRCRWQLCSSTRDLRQLLHILHEVRIPLLIAAWTAPRPRPRYRFGDSVSCVTSQAISYQSRQSGI